ncbi:AAA family ATPase [Paenibacillus sp. F6_3S_P_1C]|uniref:AAA family ATPase n=1 Tax=Paenibacillus vandeheii TaxID=3035917 RepID=A0ABT8J3L6_9BACL|nr:AAA family ATPase [Paenibacillus vandeheii]MDN4599649.1 AAA family ATPase [Paenibacillus vandeheii]
MNNINLGHVFGVSKNILKSYVERAIDYELKDKLDLTDHHIVIFGETKVGKTFLRKKYIPVTKEVVVIDCTKGINLSDIYMQILYKSGVDSIESITKSMEETNKLKGEVSANFLEFIKSKITGETVDTSKHNELIKPYIPNTVSVLVSNELEKKGINTIILDDFHYLPLIEQYQLAFDLKMFYQNGVRFVILGTKITSGYFEKFNGELSHRIDYIDATKWNDSELKEVVAKGSEALNINFTGEVIDYLINSSNSIISVFQGLLFNLCQKNDIKKPQQNQITISSVEEAQNVTTEYWERMTLTYFNKIKDIASGGRKRKLQLYYYITKIILNSEQDIIRNGFSFQYLYENLKNHHPLGESINHGALTTVLNHFDELQIDKEIFPKVFTYFDKRLSVVDSDFYFITKHLDKSKINEILPPHDYAIEINETERDIQMKLFED